MNEAGQAVAAAGTVAEEPAVPALPASRELGGERTLALLLRAGGVLGGGCFLGALALRALPDGETVHVTQDLLQKAGASFLIATPVARLGLTGVMLGLKGELRYLVYALLSLGLLAVALGAGYAA